MKNLSLFPLANQRRTTESHFNFLKLDRPSLCGCCGNPAGGFLVEIDGKWFGACSMDHQIKIKEGERLPNVAQISKAGVLYAKGQVRDQYIEYSTNNKSWELRGWREEDRNDFFEKVIREYLNYAVEQARNGVDGLNKIQDTTRTG